jgi:hypothetical protein
METSQRDVLLGTITWWGFHALLMWMGAWHFFSRDLTDGAVALLGILLVVYHAWQGKAEWGNLTDVAIWAYTFYSFGPSSWRYSLYSPLGVFGKLKT